MNIDKLLSSMTEEQKKELMNALEEQSEIESTKNKEPDPKNVGENFMVKNREQDNRGRTQVKAGKNTWQDTGEFKDEEYDEDGRQKTPRRRSAPDKVEMSCHVCGRDFKIDPKMVYGEFVRCNRCTGR